MKTTIKVVLVALCASVLVALNVGCCYRSYQEGGVKYTSFALGTTQQVAPFSLEAGKKDDVSYRKLESKGLSNDPAVELVGAAVTAAIQAAK